MLKKLIFISVFSCCGIALSGQSSRPLPFLEVNPDVRTAAMGDAAMGGTQSMFLYTNPTAFFKTTVNFIPRMLSDYILKLQVADKTTMRFRPDTKFLTVMLYSPDSGTSPV